MRINNSETNLYIIKPQQKVKQEIQKSEETKTHIAFHANLENEESPTEKIDKIPQGFHLIADGETLYSIANKYNTTVTKLVELNPNLQTDKNGNKIIKLGSIIKITEDRTKNKNEKEIYGSWQIEDGKGAYSIMSKFNLFKEELAKLNPDIDINNIQKGTVFKVPGYQIKNNDTLYSIAKKHGITLSMLKELNPGIDENLQIGEIINVPKLAGDNLGFEDLTIEFDVIDTQPQKTLHTVQKGENLYRISQNYDVPMWILMMHNNIQNENQIFPDQIIEIPSEEKITELEKLKPKNNIQEDKIKKYTIKKGDVLSQIAVDYGVSTASIMFKNNIDNPKTIKPGQTIIIPDKSEVEQLESEYKKIKESNIKKQKINISSKKQDIPESVIPESRGILTYKVKKGDTIEKIAKKYGIAAKDLATYNPGLKNIKYTTELSEKNIKNIDIVATKKAVIEATGVSEEFIDDLIAIEKKRNTLYNDACGIPTIGIGHNTQAHKDTKLYSGREISDNEVYSLLARDIVLAQNSMKTALGETYNNLTLKQKEALYGLIFNTGNFNEKSSPRLIQALKNRDYTEAACQIDHIAGTIDGKQTVMPGLVKRRFMDISKFIEGSPKVNIKTVMHKVQEMYDKGYANIKSDNTKVDYNSFAKEFLGEYIEDNYLKIKA